MGEVLHRFHKGRLGTEYDRWSVEAVVMVEERIGVLSRDAHQETTP